MAGSPGAANKGNVSEDNKEAGAALDIDHLFRGE